MGASASEFYRNRIRIEFDRIRKRNPAYSLRAFAGKLDLHPGTLSSVLKGKRGIPRRKGTQVAARLGLTGLERKFFLESLNARDAETPDSAVAAAPVRMLELQLHSTIIAEWEHSAVISLFDLTGFRPTAEAMTSRLGVPQSRLRVVLRNLERAGFVRRGTGGVYAKVASDFATPDDIPSSALREAHFQELELARRKLESEPVERRQYSSLTVALAPENLPKAKELTRKFMMELGTLLERGERSEVYQVCLQIFPLTEAEK